MSKLQEVGNAKMTNFRWTVVAMLFFATTINYLDRQVLSLTWDEFIKPEFHWNESHYGTITSFFSIFYAISMLFAGRFVEWMGTEERVPLGHRRLECWRLFTCCVRYCH